MTRERERERERDSFKFDEARTRASSGMKKYIVNEGPKNAHTIELRRRPIVKFHT